MFQLQRIYDIKTAAQPFDTFYDILRSLSLVQSLLEALNSPNWRQRPPTHMNLSGTERLTHIFKNIGPVRVNAIKRAIVDQATDLQNKCIAGWDKQGNDFVPFLKDEAKQFKVSTILTP